jgi:hypothetical protein
VCASKSDAPTYLGELEELVVEDGALPALKRVAVHILGVNSTLQSDENVSSFDSPLVPLENEASP